jgi:8-oxo-dGTP diphosphatase
LSIQKSCASVHVVAGAVIDATGRVLIAQRPLGKHMAGGWEFPGGKLQPGEDRREGLKRELREEIGIDIATPRPLLRVRHAYPDREVLLDVWVIRHYSGEPRGLDGQALRWCTQDELPMASLLPADKPIVAALRLPERLSLLSTADYIIGDPSQPAQDGRIRGSMCASAAEAVQRATTADFIVLRDALATAELAALCGSVDLPVYARGHTLEEAWELGASGVSEIGR